MLSEVFILKKDYTDQLINSILGKLTLEYDIFKTPKKQIELREILEIELYKYNIGTKETSLTITNAENKIPLFLAVKKLEGMSDKTLKNYKYELQKFSDFMPKAVEEITHNDVRMYLITRCKDIKETSKATKIYILKAFFQWLLEEEYVDKNIMDKIKTPKIPKRLREGLALEQIELLREACKTPRQRAIFELFITSGIRVSELSSLNIKDLNLNDLSAKVIGKGNKERKFLFTPKAKILIQQYLETRNDESPALFVSKKIPYNRLSTRAIQIEIKAIRTNSGIDEDVFPHKLRHSFCEIKANSGMSMTVLQKLMGHGNLSTTERYYTINDDVVKGEYKKLSN